MRSSDSLSAREEQLAELLAAPPPRRVTPEFLGTARRESAPLSGMIVGFLIFAFGAAFGSVFFPWRVLDELRLAKGETATASGRVLAVEGTRMTLNKRRVMRYEFDFVSAGGTRTTAVCHTTGQRWRPGRVVTVKYLRADPAVACIEGARLGVTGWGFVFVGIFPALGIWVVVGTVRARRRTRWLLEHGTVGDARVADVEAIVGQKKNAEMAHRITLVLATAEGERTVKVVRSQREIVALAQQRLAAQQPVFVLYDPRQPKHLLLPETLGLR